MSEDNDEFKLEGLFLIQKIFEIKPIEGMLLLDITQDFKRLPPFRPGNPDKIGFGFEKISIDQIPQNIEEDEKLNELVQNLAIIEFRKEKYGKQFDRYDSDKKPIEKIKLKGNIFNHIFFIYPKYVLFKGSKENMDYLEQKFFKLVHNIGKKKELSFDPDFILWILINYRNKNYELIPNFFVDFFTDLSTSGDFEDFMGRYISSKESSNVALSVPMLLTILSGRDTISCKFAFTIDGYSGTIEIRNTKSFFIAHSIGIFNLVSNTEKVIISIHFIIRLVELYFFWQGLNPQKKYPNENDFLNIIRDCKKLGLRVYDIDDVVDKYKKKIGVGNE